MLFTSFTILGLCWLVGARLASAVPQVFYSGDYTRDQHILLSSDKARSPAYFKHSLWNDHRQSQQAPGFVAFGDSYSAGIGTGVDGVEDECRLGSHAYPVLIFTDLAESQAPGTATFQFLSCTGSTTSNVLSGGDHSQVDSFNKSVNADFAVLSIGGNDLGFFSVMNACIFRFYSFNSGSCETALQYVTDQIESSDFSQRLEMVIMEILDTVQWEKRPWFIITVTGYARFFSVETDECDNCTLGVWWQGPKLKKDVRQRMNDMVVAVNEKLRSSIEAVNSRFTTPKVLFVDYDAEFEGHRFCEPGVMEPAYNRTETWFFLVGGKDNNPNMTDPTPAPNRTTVSTEGGASSNTLSPLSPLADPETCLGPAERSGDWGLLALCYMARAKRDYPSLQFAAEDVMIRNSMWYVPTSYGKTFHPRSLGHEVIRDEIYRIWSRLDMAR
ncbi:SGNH hydrolase-type esterase domain-containing protein [Colletotrichum phormii]|uniref:SGNH hydrolase-type esterase domain-containing protein n=1 Tax=Colletotrichum phormii TaxID=359342 RepID=A0AAJ0EKU3_9PEZI|nr:SGNH hydrolase-type esterase domain-containing protein [Colletotrichum phormii]KAK1640255.1 SGNH hydrolase-type esterase domain-containing protein [Colletotrichum phormii]